MPDTQVSEAAIRAPNTMTIDDEVETLITQCKNLAAKPVTEDNKGDFRKLMEDEVKLRTKIERLHKDEKAPHLEAGRAVDAKFLPHIPKLKDAVKAVNNALTKFMDAEREKAEAARRAAQQAAADEAARAAKLAEEAAAVEDDDPFAAFAGEEEARRAEAESAALSRQAVAPVKVSVASSDGGRAAGLRIVGWNVEVTDPSDFVAHYAERMEILELAKTLAQREAKATNGQAKIPGCTLTPIRKAV